MSKKRTANNEREKIELEKQLVKEGKIFPRAHYAPRGRLRGVIALCLAFLFGIFVILGGLIGLGVYFSSRKLKDVFTMFHLDPSAYLTEEFGELSAVEAVAEVVSTPITNFASIGRITPAVTRIVDNLVGQFEELGADVDPEQFMQVNFSEFGGYFRDDILMNIELGKALNLNASSDAVMLSLCYGRPGFDYTVADDGSIVMNEGKSPTLLHELVDDASGIVGKMDVKTALNVSDSSAPIVQAIKDWKVEDLNNPARINRLRIKQVVTMGENPSSLLKAIADWRIGDLSDQKKIDSLKLGDVITVNESSPRILQAIKEFTIGELNTEINKLRLDEILSESEISGNRILKHLATSTLDTLSDDLKALTVGEVFADQVYSYMEIVSDDDTVKDYEYYDKQYREHCAEDAKYSTAEYRPTAIPNVTKDESFRTYRVDSKGNEVNAAYYLRGGEEEPYSYEPLPAGAAVEYDAVIARTNRTPVAAGPEEEPAKPVWVTPYYWDREYEISPHFAYGVVDYDNGGAIVPLPEGFVQETEEGIRIADVSGVHLLSEDDNCLYYFDADGNRIDIDRSVDVYTRSDGVKYTYDAETKSYLDENGNAAIIRSRAASVDADGNEIPAHEYVVERFKVYKMYGEADALIPEEETEERYEYTKEEKKVALDRYITGVWHLILKSEESGDMEGSTEIVYRDDTPILEMDALVSKVTGVINDTKLSELWFHGILQSSPFVDLGAKVPGGVEIKVGEESKHISNLIEVTMGETVALVQALVDKIPAAGG